MVAFGFLSQNFWEVAGTYQSSKVLGEPVNLKELCETVYENENILSGKQIMMMSQEGFK